MEYTNLGQWVTYIVLGLGIVYLFILIYYVIAASVSDKLRKKLTQAQKQELSTSQFIEIMPVWIVLIISSFFFGLAHTYQGLGNVIRTSLIGLFWLFCISG